jgi:hypothetical protein
MTVVTTIALVGLSVAGVLCLARLRGRSPTGSSLSTRSSW